MRVRREWPTYFARDSLTNLVSYACLKAVTFDKRFEFKMPMT